MEMTILAAEEERDRLGTLLQDPAFYSDSPERVTEVSSAFKEATARVDALYERWEELEGRR
jgi:hypothetical protein